MNCLLTPCVASVASVVSLHLTRDPSIRSSAGLHLFPPTPCRTGAKAPRLVDGFC